MQLMWLLLCSSPFMLRVDQLATENFVNEGGQSLICLGVFEIQHVICIVLLAVQVDVEGANAA